MGLSDGDGIEHKKHHLGAKIYASMWHVGRALREKNREGLRRGGGAERTDEAGVCTGEVNSDCQSLFSLFFLPPSFLDICLLGTTPRHTCLEQRHGAR